MTTPTDPAPVTATSAPPKDRRIGPPSSTASVRSMPGKAEKGPSAATSAIDSRASKPDRSAPSGQTASSCVTPPPFFQRLALPSPRRSSLT